MNGHSALSGGNRLAHGLRAWMNQYSEDVFLVMLQQFRDIELERRELSFVPPERLAIEPHVGQIIHAIETQPNGFVLPAGRHSERFADTTILFRRPSRSAGCLCRSRSAGFYRFAPNPNAHRPARSRERSCRQGIPPRKPSPRHPCRARRTRWSSRCRSASAPTRSQRSLVPDPWATPVWLLLRNETISRQVIERQGSV